MKFDIFIFYTLFLFNVIALVLLAIVNFGLLESQIVPVIAFGILFFTSPFLLVSSIYEFTKDKENLMTYMLGSLLSLGGILIVILVIISISNISP